jgi:hypothetical protein
MWQVFWGGPIFRFEKNMFSLLMKLNTKVVWNEKTSYVLMCT